METRKRLTFWYMSCVSSTYADFYQAVSLSSVHSLCMSLPSHSPGILTSSTIRDFQQENDHKSCSPSLAILQRRTILPILITLPI